MALAFGQERLAILIPAKSKPELLNQGLGGGWGRVQSWLRGAGSSVGHCLQHWWGPRNPGQGAKTCKAAWSNNAVHQLMMLMPRTAGGVVIVRFLSPQKSSTKLHSLRSASSFYADDDESESTSSAMHGWARGSTLLCASDFNKCCSCVLPGPSAWLSVPS